MAPRITLRTLLLHMQGMKNDLQQQILGLDKKVGKIEIKLTNLETEVHEGFMEARLHRESLQEDLDATIRMQYKHDKKLARL